MSDHGYLLIENLQVLASLIPGSPGSLPSAPTVLLGICSDRYKHKRYIYSAGQQM